MQEEDSFSEGELFFFCCAAGAYSKPGGNRINAGESPLDLYKMTIGGMEKFCRTIGKNTEKCWNYNILGVFCSVSEIKKFTLS